MPEDYLPHRRLSLIPTRSNPTSEATGRDTESTGDEEPPVPAVLQSLEDDKCRAILRVLREPKSVPDLCDECGLANSTAYRKLERLRDAGLVREYTEVRRDGPNATLYERDFTEISVRIDENDEFSLTVDRPTEEPEDRMAAFWSEMRRES
ncbi:winged helix-turn-helix domain-containing protein [Haloarchaeobius iranensis]|uniref:Helix-turn-helix domain-containing protein n=1 Tax=Haloarchaeobius iranensis TaxID=996166 RepID=A0A1H0AJZ5_9EURY|nr:helix-turn-helix domain-containing protein [Haloarchaeobius iranensis]SDN33126.1 Helix-turn-helix domain-containing protein [Haloarchaeobius iranensis]